MILTKWSSRAAQTLALLGLAGLIVAATEWKVRADDSHKEITKLAEAVVYLGDREKLRQAVEEARKARDSAKADLLAKLCKDGKLAAEECS